MSNYTAGQNVVIYPGTVIGDGCRIGDNVVLGGGDDGPHGPLDGGPHARHVLLGPSRPWPADRQWLALHVLLAPVEAILQRLATRVAVTSGYLAGELPAHRGWEHVASVELDGWAADLLRSPTV